MCFGYIASTATDPILTKTSTGRQSDVPVMGSLASMPGRSSMNTCFPSSTAHACWKAEVSL